MAEALQVHFVILRLVDWWLAFFFFKKEHFLLDSLFFLNLPKIVEAVCPAKGCLDARAAACCS